MSALDASRQTSPSRRSLPGGDAQARGPLAALEPPKRLTIMDQSEQKAIALAAANAPELPAAPSWQRARLPLILAGLSCGRRRGLLLSHRRPLRIDRRRVRDDGAHAISANVAGRVVELAVHDNQARAARRPALSSSTTRRSALQWTRPQAQLATATLQVEALKANYLQRQSELARPRTPWPSRSANSSASSA